MLVQGDWPIRPPDRLHTSLLTMPLQYTNAIHNMPSQFLLDTACLTDVRYELIALHTRADITKGIPCSGSCLVDV